MELAMGAMASLGPKLAELLKEEYVVQKGLKPEIESLSRELVMIHAVLAKVSRVPPEELDEVDKIWASQVRELSYDMEDAVDAFMVRVVGRKSVDPNFFKRISGKITSVMKKAKDRHQISGTIKEIKSISQELAELRARYTFNNSGADHTKNCNVDPRVLNLYKYEDELVGIEGSRDELIRRLTETEGDMRLKVISIVGFGGLGKTSLAKIVYDKLKGQSFDCAAFVSVGRNPKITGIFESTLEQLDKTHSNVNMARWNEGRFIDELHTVLQAKRLAHGHLLNKPRANEFVKEIVSCNLGLTSSKN
uniref:Rx N-terminal domain-containing protein n=1 Tax=Leersia perrieri TaxID=77586 RepID=A0A0D9WG11_9ORYZ